MKLSVLCTLVILGFVSSGLLPEVSSDAGSTPIPGPVSVSTQKSINTATPTSVPSKRPTRSKYVGIDPKVLIAVEESFIPPWFNNPFPFPHLQRLWRRRRDVTSKPQKGGKGKPPSFKDIDQPVW
uniref:Uncharacterized protein LOC114327732 n=1 Tax=Diabrotica virgifera virgifera TaxID=50390 RepID=A0A6P7F9K5_DIAVI